MNNFSVSVITKNNQSTTYHNIFKIESKAGFIVITDVHGNAEHFNKRDIQDVQAEYRKEQ